MYKDFINLFILQPKGLNTNYLSYLYHSDGWYNALTRTSDKGFARGGINMRPNPFAFKEGFLK